MEISKIAATGADFMANSVKSPVSDESFNIHLQNALKNKDDKELREVYREFEGILLNMMYKQMKATVPESDFMQDNPAGEIFQSMLDEKMVDEASKTGSLELADMLYKLLRK